LLQTAIEAAKQAGQVIAERYPAGRNVAFKGYRDLVTDTDVAAEAAILDLIRARFPDHAILSEESGGEAGGDYTWVVDPLDGTTNYAHHVPIFCTSVGVLERDRPIIGVIHDPLREQTFVAERGKGVVLNGEPIRASRTSRLIHSAVGLDWGHSDEVRGQTLRLLLQIAPRCGTVRALGSAALVQAYVAAGWLDAYFNLSLKPWDTAAGTLLVAEAGGRCTTLKGEPFRVESPTCLATNGLIHDQLLALGLSEGRSS
jgi:myo-inositol-1(or 4)-monophosphatase